MSRAHYRHDRDRQDDMLRSLGRLAVEALRRSLLALRRGDTIGARAVIRADEDIDALQRDLDGRIYRFVALQQPVARDLRRALAASAVAAELERAGDYAGHIARCVQQLADAPRRLDAPPDLARLGELAVAMVEQAVSAFLDQDAVAARELASRDEQADMLEESVSAEVRAAVASDLGLLEAGLALLAVASTLERLADRATNIAERVVYMATGQQELLNE